MSEATGQPATSSRPLHAGIDLPLNLLDIEPAAVNERFLRARRDGTPTWLWPDVTVEAWRDSLGAIEAVTREVMTGATMPPTLDGEPEALGIAAYTSGMGPLLGYWIEHGQVTAAPPLAALFRLHLRHNRLRMDKLGREATTLAKRMSDAGAEPTLLKGMHTAHAYFPEPGTRPMSDIDLLVAPDRIGAAQEVLVAAGYTRAFGPHPLSSGTWEPSGRQSLPRSLSLTHADDAWSVDLHVTLDRNVFGITSLRLDEVPARMTDRPLSIALPGRFLGQPLLVLLLATHASALPSLSLIRMVELVLVIRRDLADGLLDWDEMVDAATSIGALRFAYPALELCDRLAPGTIPEERLESFRAAATPTMRRVVARLTPGGSQRLNRTSLEERFMWAGSTPELLRSVAYSIWPTSAGYTLSQMALIYRQRAWRLIQGTVGR